MSSHIPIDFHELSCFPNDEGRVGTLQTHPYGGFQSIGVPKSSKSEHDFILKPIVTWGSPMICINPPICEPSDK